jgi:hypothetical protein
MQYFTLNLITHQQYKFYMFFVLILMNFILEVEKHNIDSTVMDVQNVSQEKSPKFVSHI